MTIRALNIIVGKMVVSDEFREGILGGRRAQLLEDFDLEPDEVRLLMAIQADTVAEFANYIDAHIEGRRIRSGLHGSERE